MKQTIKNVWEFVTKNCTYYNFSVEWDVENEMLGLKVFKVDDDWDNEYKEQAETIKKQLEKEFGIEIYNFCEPSEWEVECMDVRRQVYMELDDLLFKCENWLDYSVEVGIEWDGKFSDEELSEYEIDYGLEF